MRKAIIVDMDGTLSDPTHRLHYVTGEEQDWETFFSLCDKDKKNNWCDEIIDGLCSQYEIIIITGRPESVRKKTLDWLQHHGVQFDKLIMRGNGDYRSDNIIKEEVYNKQIKCCYNIEFVLEDRKVVVDMWRKLGLTTLQCAEGNF